MGLKEFLRKKVESSTEDKTANQIIKDIETEVDIKKEKYNKGSYHYVSESDVNSNELIDIAVSFKSSLDEDLFDTFVNSKGLSLDNKDNLKEDNEDFNIEENLILCKSISELESLVNSFSCLRMNPNRLKSIIIIIIELLDRLCEDRFKIYFGDFSFVGDVEEDNLDNYTFNIVRNFYINRMNVTKSSVNINKFSEESVKEYKDYVNIEINVLGSVIVSIINKSYTEC